MRCLLALLAVGWVITTAAPLPPAGTPDSLGLPASTKAAWRALSPGFVLPDRDRSLRVVRTLKVDVDADGDIDALAATSTGRIIVWMNVGGNRLVRRTPKPATPVHTRLSRRATSGVAGATVDVSTIRWAMATAERLFLTPDAAPASRLTSVSLQGTTPDLRPDPRGPPAYLQHS